MSELGSSYETGADKYKDAGLEKYKRPGEDDEESGEGLKESIALIKNQCAHVYGELENGEKLDELIDAAQEFYSADESGWDRLLNKTREDLANEEDPGVIRDILRSAMTDAGELMD